MVLRRARFGTADKILAWILAGVWGIGGGLGIVLAVINARWLLGFISAIAVGAGVLYAVAAWKGRPLNW